MTHRILFFFVVGIQFFSHSVFAQRVTEEPFPKLPFSQHSEKIVPGYDSTFFIVGSTTYQNKIFDDTYGITVAYYFKKNGSQLFPVITLPDTNHFFQRGFDAQYEVIQSDFAVSDLNIPYVAWSKLFHYWQDYPPYVTYRWKFSTQIGSEISGKFGVNLHYENAINPSLAYGNDIHGLRIVYEDVTPLDTIKVIGPDSSKFRFTKYISTICYDIPFTPTMPPRTIIKLGKGFCPLIKKGYDNQIHILWFDADSSTATSFKLKYRKDLSYNTFDSTVDLISLPINIISYFRNNYLLDWSVDTGGTVHVSWGTKNILHYNKIMGVRIDSLSSNAMSKLNVKFMPNGETRVLWSEDWGPLSFSHLNYSTSAQPPLYSNKKYLGEVFFMQHCSQMIDTSGNGHLFLYGDPQYLRKNFATEKDTTIFLYKGYTTLSDPYVDKNNIVWTVAKRDSTPVLMKYNLDEVGKNNFTFPLRVGDEWYYLQYAEPPNGTLPTEHIVKATRDTIMPNKKTYIEISSKDWGNRYWRKEDSKIFQFSQRDSSEFIRFDFTKAIKETIATVVVENQSRSIVVENINSREVLGKNLLNFRFMGDIVNDYYGRSGVDVSDSLGITHFGLIGPETFLIGAKIDVKQYGTILGVENKKEQQPTTFSLSQNYPNPFNPKTVINYQLPINNFTTLKIYDVIGREVATLVNEVKEAGIYKVQFDASKPARLGRSGGLSSGLYFYSIKSGEYRSTKKMSLIK